MQIELASYRAVRADRPCDLVRSAESLSPESLPGNELEDGTSGTDANAFTAPGTAGMIGIAISAHDDLGMLTAQPYVEHADFLNILAGAYAPGAQDARAHVM